MFTHMTQPKKFYHHLFNNASHLTYQISNQCNIPLRWEENKYFEVFQEQLGKPQS